MDGAPTPFLNAALNLLGDTIQGGLNVIDPPPRQHQLQPSRPRRNSSPPAYTPPPTGLRLNVLGNEIGFGVRAREHGTGLDFHSDATLLGQTFSSKAGGGFDNQSNRRKRGSSPSTGFSLAAEATSPFGGARAHAGVRSHGGAPRPRQ